MDCNVGELRTAFPVPSIFVLLIASKLRSKSKYQLMVRRAGLSCEARRAGRENRLYGLLFVVFCCCLLSEDGGVVGWLYGLVTKLVWYSMVRRRVASYGVVWCCIEAIGLQCWRSRWRWLLANN